MGFRAIGHDHGSMCHPDSWFQWHGLWHIFSGAMAILLYFYWRRENDSSAQPQVQAQAEGAVWT
jgi:hypothetical protein